MRILDASADDSLMRSSFALAGEKDPLILLSTLLRILCQYARADFAAIALTDERDRSSLRLLAAGPYSRIVPYDLSMNDEACHSVCPAGYMLHVARTGKVGLRMPNVTNQCLVHHHSVPPSPPSGLFLFRPKSANPSMLAHHESRCTSWSHHPFVHIERQLAGPFG